MCCLFGTSWADVEIEKVLETSSVSEYNQWVGKNKAIFPALEPILVDYTVSFETSPTRTYRIRYYTEHGDEISTEIVEDSLTFLYVPPTNDRILFKTPGKTVVKNARGEILFTVPHGIAYIGMGIYIESLEHARSPGAEVDVLNSRGETIGRLQDLYNLDYSRLCIADDERYAFLVGFVEHIGHPIVLVDKSGKELWRHMLDSNVEYPFLSRDGSKIGIHHGTSVLIYNEDGSLFRKYYPFGQEGPQANALSDDGHLLVTVRGSRIHCFNNKDGSLLWKNDTAFIEDKGRVRFLGIIGDGDIIVAICRSHNLYVFDGKGKVVSKTNLELGTKWVTLPSDPTKKIEKLITHWGAEFVGKYVIITKGKGGARIEPHRKIVYRIVLD